MSKKTDVINYIQTQIEANSLKPGQRLLSEEDLAKKLKVSRTTIRLALTDLVLQGTIEKRPSSGNYISNKKVSKSIFCFSLVRQKFTQNHPVRPIQWKSSRQLL